VQAKANAWILLNLKWMKVIPRKTTSIIADSLHKRDKVANKKIIMKNIIWLRLFLSTNLSLEDTSIKNIIRLKKTYHRSYIAADQLTAYAAIGETINNVEAINANL
jgi:hypothetical protein